MRVVTEGYAKISFDVMIPGYGNYVSNDLKLKADQAFLHSGLQPLHC